MYIVMGCVDREMFPIGVFDDIEAAKAAMLRSIKSVVESYESMNIGDVVDYLTNCAADADISPDNTSAWLNDYGLAHADYDWKIFELEKN